jgi:hypothetical protein
MISRESDEIFRNAIDEYRNHNRARQRKIRREIRSLWKDIFDIYRCVYRAAQLTSDLGYDWSIKSHDDESCTTRSSCIPGSTCDHRIAVEVLHSLLARACTASHQIDHAIGSGYDSESLTLLRSVHEALVIAAIIERGDTPTLAVRYYDFGAVRSYRYHQARSDWREAPEWYRHDDAEIARMRAVHDNVLRKFGKTGDYEWARSEVDVKPNKPVRLADLEKSAGMTHRQPLYKILCEVAHVSPRSALGNWLTQKESGNGFIPAANWILLLGQIPDVLLTTARMLEDLSAIIARCCQFVNYKADLQELQNWIALNVADMVLIIADVREHAHEAGIP